MGSIVHPRLLASLGAFYPSLCTIQEPGPKTRDEYGQSQPSWPNLAGHVDIRCRISPDGKGREVKAPDQTYAITSHRIALQGHYPAITPAMRAVSGATTYDILAVESDGSGAATTLVCQVVK
jgi:hypothetical protein